MSRKTVVLSGCARYNYKGDLYEAGHRYSLGESRAEALLRLEDDWGRRYFREVSDDVTASAPAPVEETDDSIQDLGSVETVVSGAEEQVVMV